MITLINRSTIKARVNHTCSWCEEDIGKGEQYIKSNYVDGGEFDTVKSHTKCDYLLKNLVEKYGNIDGMSPDDFSYMLACFIEDKKGYSEVQRIICRGNINDMVNEAYSILKDSVNS